ncbi:hypothetical protein Tco_1505456 [Tanacetum coccineum]
MLILLVQAKLTNLNVEERLAFSVSLRMFTRSIVIQRRVEDLQLGVESYQMKLNITNPDTYRSDLKRRKAYYAYSNPIGFIYQNKDKKNKLMRVDELHKFSDGTLNDVRTALDDRLKGIRMEYLPQTIWRKSDRERAAAMIQAIDKQLKSRRIMRSLKRFVGGRPYSNPMIQPEPKGSTQGYPLDSVEVLRFNIIAGNPVKEILLKLNLPDHRLIITDSKGQIKMEMERRSVKVKELRERCIITAFKLSNQERFTSPSGREFVDEMVATVDPVELDTFSTDQVKLILTNCLGYDKNSSTFLYIKKPNCSFDSGLVPLADAIQERDMILMYTHHNRLHVYVSQVELSPLVVAQQHKDETNKTENQRKHSCSKKLFE